MNVNKQANIIKIIFLFSLAITIISLAIIYFLRSSPKPLAREVTQTSEVLIGGDFAGLTDQNGQPFSSNDLKGKLSLIYFGFTYCPDVCPTTLNKLSQVVEVITKYNIDINPVFITIDPERDTQAILKEYLGHFHPKFIGLTATPNKIRQVADLYKVFYTKAQSKDATEGEDLGKYMIDHSSFCYLMDKNGKYLKHFTLDTPAEEIIEYIRINKK